MSQPEVCRHHPDRKSAAYCQKYNTGLCEECLENDPKCADPSIYCKFREQCVIHYSEKEKKREDSRNQAASA